MARQELLVIPAPASVVHGAGRFTLTRGTRLFVGASEPKARAVAERLAALLNRSTGFELRPEDGAPNDGDVAIELRLDPSVASDEGYRLRVTASRVELSARTAVGLFYAAETLRELGPVELDAPGPVPDLSVSFPVVTVEDAPRFSYRGMHLDVSRHFFSVEFVKRTIDALARLKMNRFHFHLTDDQGWRLEIKRYPKLTAVGGFRNETLIGHNRDEPHRFDGVRYGGFYTQEEIREIVRYAEERFVTVVPEIELPGHALAALAAYPELGCTPGPFAPATKWGIFEDVYCPKEATFEFLKHVLEEVVALFPSEYVHIGGDEVPKVRWKKSADAQAVMRREKLRSEEELQSYFIRRVSDMLSAHGRKLIGWDEILEGGAPPGATVMAWRSVGRGIEAAEQGHDVILAPESDVYFNKYQDSDVDAEPLAIGGHIPVEQVYAFEPVPDDMQPGLRARVLGAEGCLWTEYVKTPELAEYHVFPRLQALAEVLWSPKSARSLQQFVRRLPAAMARMDLLGLKYAKHVFKVKQSSAIAGDGRYLVTLGTYNDDEVRYTLDGSEPTLGSPRYTGPIVLEGPTRVRAAAFSGGQALSRPVAVEYFVHRAVGRSVSYGAPFSEKYPALREYALTNGIKGSRNFGDGAWQGFEGVDLEVTLDLGAAHEIRSLSATFLRDQAVWILLPSRVDFWVSEDGERFRSLGGLVTSEDPRDPKQLVKDYTLDVSGAPVRYVRVRAQNFGKLPDWHPGRGNSAWLFVSEIVVE